ncbi:MAG: hypothetical protein JWO38_3362 [Gemmataceae bacterium]|nr:hypothetical protein [Gemmataceae bacterium]
MTDRESLLAVVLDTPGDATARLVLSDYLQDRYEPALGRFIRAGVVPPGSGTLPPERGPPAKAAGVASEPVIGLEPSRAGTAGRRVSYLPTPRSRMQYK